MGKLDHDLHIQHFSHPHLLELSNFQDNIITQNSPLCSSCKYPQSGSMYSCNLCNFHIHSSCTKSQQQITHPSHPTHALRLLPASNYPGGQFSCNACNRPGDGFRYHCHHCKFDLHVGCASKPLSIIHQSHAHTLDLAFRFPYETNGFFCNICKKIGSKQWLYRCDACMFDAHLDCATGTPPPSVPQPKPVEQPPQLLQTHHSFPGAAVQQNQFHNHLSCTKSQQQITHPSHPTTHALRLLPASNYPSGQFKCNACNRPGDGFRYHCNHCNFDLHVVCAYKPLSIIHQSHAHTLGLAFRYPYETKGFSCDICKKSGSKQWLYRCDECGFDAHLYCATGTPPPPVPQPKPVAQPPQLLQTHYSFPGAAVQQNQFQTPVAGRMNNNYLQQPVPPMPQQGYTVLGGRLMNAVLLGFVGGAAQEVGQDVMQSFTGGGGGDGSSSEFM